MLILLVALLVAVGCAAPAPQEGARRKRPNIVLIMADDIGTECYGCYGSEQYRTPHIDRLAEQGTRFSHCHSSPLCTPSRVKIMTGLSNVRNYSGFSVLNPDQTTFGHRLQKAGYKTFVGGKWQLLGAEHYPDRFRGRGTWPLEAGFDGCCLWQVDQLGGRYWNPLLNVNGENRQFGPDDYGPDVVALEIERFMEAENGGPFFVYYPMILTHDPFRPTPSSASRDSRDKQANFEDMVERMDAQVGRIAAKIEALGIAEDTLILVTGDNGTHRSISSVLGRRRVQGGKGKTTDAATHVALVAYQPGTVPAGEVCGDLIDFTDFVPTLQEVAGAAVPDGIDGVSFAPQLRGLAGTPREWLYCYYNPRPERTEPTRFVRNHRWKLYGDGRLFDVGADPKEQKPHSGETVEAAAARERLGAALASMPATGQSLLSFE